MFSIRLTEIRFSSIRALTPPYAAPSLLHIAVLLDHRSNWHQTDPNPKKWTEIELFQVQPRPNPSLDLNAQSLSWLHGGRLLRAILVIGVLEEKALGLFWLWVRRNRRDLFQNISSTNCEDTQGEPNPREDSSKRKSGYPSWVDGPRPDKIWMWIRWDK